MWSVAAAGPMATVTAQSLSTIADRTADFVLTATPGATFECALDGAELAPCASPQGFSSLADGAHTFVVQTTVGGVTGTAFTDFVGPDEFTFVVDDGQAVPGAASVSVLVMDQAVAGGTNTENPSAHREAVTTHGRGAADVWVQGQWELKKSSETLLA